MKNESGGRLPLHLAKQLYDNCVCLNDGIGKWCEDLQPVCKLVIPGVAAWLLVYVEEHEPTTAFGLCDLRQGTPALGHLDLLTVNGPGIHWDVDFRATKTLKEYEAEARTTGSCLDF